MFDLTFPQETRHSIARKPTKRGLGGPVYGGTSILPQSSMLVAAEGSVLFTAVLRLPGPNPSHLSGLLAKEV